VSFHKRRHGPDAQLPGVIDPLRPTECLPLSSCATCSASTPPRPRTFSTAARRRSTAPCNAPGPRPRRASQPATGERAPLPHSPRERELVGHFADALESGDVDPIVSCPTDDPWLTMPPYPLEYQGQAAITGFLRDRARLLGAPPAGVHTSQRTARVRLLPPRCTRGNRAPIWAARAHARGRPHLSDHLVRRQQRILVVVFFRGSRRVRRRAARARQHLRAHR
jgi:hypothetical protein